MSIRFHYLIIVLAGAAAVFVGCEKNAAQPAAPSPLTNAQSVAVGEPAQLAANGESQHAVTIFDACDPDSFNAALGAGTCVRNGGLLFDSFIELLRRHQSAGAWHFTPPQAQLSVGDALVAVNHGGETHTFTEVEDFGGGIVPLLNDLTGLTTVAPECSQLTPGNFIPAGGSSSEVEDEEGVEKYQCCIHPWMRAEIRVGKR